MPVSTIVAIVQVAIVIGGLLVGFGIFRGTWARRMTEDDEFRKSVLSKLDQLNQLNVTVSNHEITITALKQSELSTRSAIERMDTATKAAIERLGTYIQRVELEITELRVLVRSYGKSDKPT